MEMKSCHVPSSWHSRHMTEWSSGPGYYVLQNTSCSGGRANGSICVLKIQLNGGKKYPDNGKALRKCQGKRLKVQRLSST